MTESYSIAEMVARTGLTAHTLRYYERAGLIEPPPRERNGHRRYTAADLGMITILTKLRATGMPIEGMRRYSALCRQGPGNEADRRALLLEHREQVLSRLDQLQADLAVVDRKIEMYAPVTASAADAGRSETVCPAVRSRRSVVA
ncbi:DNA-binding transcriptional regulator, MerR family [Micromonospora nigra]|uniref:DNA-binding transcriptional regulator, MerR family n=1 Tax=Micromonospora nigra TaxID=145857 RepID=A0A1C6S7Z7_9ACTN|nr:MerR family transcriptional regulator [Micromonospora nigra]SCL25565.1 DNA-binding transcriptional regulator, MerR family [Micromonospora nigra]